MIATVALALFLRQNPVPPPALPVGTSPEFAKLALDIEAKLVEGDVAGAKEAAKALPVRTPRFAWAGDEILPPALRAAQKEALSVAIASWARQVKRLVPIEGEAAPELTVGFAQTLPDGPDGMPLATQIEAGPPFRATIGLNRGKPGRTILRPHLAVELAYAFGRYFGVPETPFPGSAMYRDSRYEAIPTMPQLIDALVAESNLNLAEKLRAGVEAGKPIGLIAPSVRLVKPRLDLGDARQGQPIYSEIEIENIGAGPLDYRVERDCSCYAPFKPGTVAPQGRVRLPVAINTSDYSGPQDKVLLLVTNDPARPLIEIPVTFRSRPAYRIFRPGGPNVLVPDAGGAYDVFFFTDATAPITPIRAQWEGVEGSVVSMTPWSGSLADPEMKEGLLPRKGWRIRVKISSKLDPGHWPGSLVLTTDSKNYSTVTYSMTAQKGIAADDVFLGNVVVGTRASFLVTKPGMPFKILSVDAGPLKATWKERRTGEYQVDLEYVGGLAQGDLTLPIKIRTDDPKFSTVETMVRGTVK